MVDSLKNKLISGVSFQLQKNRWKEKCSRKPIEKWTHLASAMAGTLEVVVSAAFSQILVVLSTETCTLRNCDLSPVHSPPGQIVPLRPILRVPVQGKVPAKIPVPVFLKTPAATMGPARRLPAPCQVVRVPTRTCLPFQPASSSSSSSSSRTPPLGLSSATGQVGPGWSSALAAAAERGSRSKTTPLPSSPQTHLSPSSVPTTAPQSLSVLPTHPTVPHSSSVAAPHTSFGQNSKQTTFAVKCVVDFEKIYNFLSAVQNSSEDFHLTPMESAVVLDLLMSLPEELCLLDCKNLHKHMVQVYESVSAPADVKAARELLMKVEFGPGSQGVGSPRGHQPAPAGPADGAPVSDSGGKEGKLDASGGPNMSQSCPPLNPFMVPLQLLQRRQTSAP
ncbi:snRNA-activating protein complex subunit 2 isoform X2 [Kryptolebias marmoratus]|nr:snRNA-activating protein complex subunit 2 isoform X2 [Kryptolebias marmoratus]